MTDHDDAYLIRDLIVRRRKANDEEKLDAVAALSRLTVRIIELEAEKADLEDVLARLHGEATEGASG